MDALTEFLRKRNISFAEHCPTAKYSTFRIGGTARLAVFPQSVEQMIDALTAARDAKEEYAVVGKGSNLLFPDGEYGGVLIFTTRMAGLISDSDGFTALAGVPLGAVAIRARERSLEGAEFMGGIPGTVGGAVLMNAGAYGRCMADVVTWVECFDGKTGQIKRFERDAHEFGYRTSLYARSTHLTVLSVGMRLQSGERVGIDALMEDYRRRRTLSQPQGYPNAGSIFKNPEGASAGALIEACGLKGCTVGGACVSEKHANFIVNKGGATARDVTALIALVRSRVLQQTGIELQCELKQIKTVKEIR